jgi:hypothetical protein
VSTRPFKVEGPRAECLGDAISDVFLSNKGVEGSLREISKNVEEFSIELEGFISKIAEENMSSRERFADVFISVSVDFRAKCVSSVNNLLATT